ncbi:MAG: tetratricopeptide repeat protein [Deltaproteobacteria bacterium]|nr:tetratricopeptide repeat protein [Deltaproteobacteria bacterium]
MNISIIKNGKIGLSIALSAALIFVGCEWSGGSPDGGRDVIEFHSSAIKNDAKLNTSVEPLIVEPDVEVENELVSIKAESRSEQLLDIALSHMDDDLVDHVKIAYELSAAGDPAAAMIELGKALFDDANNYQAAMQLGQIAKKNSKPNLAEKAFMVASQIDPESVEAWLQLTRLSLANKDFDLAEERIQRALSEDPKVASAHNLLGRIWLSRSHWEKSIRSFKKATILAPENRFYRNNLGFAYLLKKNFNQAVIQLELAVAGENTPAYMINNLGLAYEGAGRLQDAIATFGQVTEQHPRYLKAQINLERLIVLAQNSQDEENPDSL